jgi:hypothetical protein
MTARGGKCEFTGDENTRQGRLVACREKAVVQMRLRGLEGIPIGKPEVCERHMWLMLSGEVRAAGRDWQIDRWLNEEVRVAGKSRGARG